MKTKATRFYYRVAVVATVLAFIVILLGAYTRLKDGGLGCPDWPGCYGQLSVPQTAKALDEAKQLFPGQMVEPQKAWLEMIHRYFAGTLALFIFMLTLAAFVRRRVYDFQPIVIPIFMFGLLLFQAALGMWTVTLKLLPVVVMGHLLGGMLIISLLWSLALSVDWRFRMHPADFFLKPYLKLFAVIGALIVFLQIFLGGWTSSNYAALVCPEFPLCKGSLFPAMNFSEAFNFFSPIGPNYEGGVLDTTGRITIQMAHRYGAFITLIYVGCFSLYLIFSRKTYHLHVIGFVILTLLVIQILLGILNVIWLLPWWIAVAHNGVAVLLLLSMVTLLCRLFYAPLKFVNEK